MRASSWTLATAESRPGEGWPRKRTVHSPLSERTSDASASTWVDISSSWGDEMDSSWGVHCASARACVMREIVAPTLDKRLRDSNKAKV